MQECIKKFLVHSIRRLRTLLTAYFVFRICIHVSTFFDRETIVLLSAGDMANEDSTGMFEDFLINGKGSTTLDETLTNNNIMSEDSLLNNIIMRDELVTSSDSLVIDSGKNDVLAKNGTLLENEKSNPPEVSATSCTAAVPTKENDQTTDPNPSTAVGGALSTTMAASKKEVAGVQTDMVDSQAKPCNNFSGILKADVKSEDRSGTVNVMTKNLMLAELLEKNSERKEPPMVNGAVRLSEKGFELISKEELQRNIKAAYQEKTVICSNKKVSSS